MASRSGGAKNERRLSLPLSPKRPSLRFFSPLIEPDVTIWVIRLSDRVSRQGMRRGARRTGGQSQDAEFPKHHGLGKLSVAGASHIVPASQKAADRVIQMEMYIAPRFRARPVAEVDRPSPRRAVQVADQLLPRHRITAPQPSSDAVLDGRHGLPGRPRPVVAAAGSR